MVFDKEIAHVQFFAEGLFLSLLGLILVGLFEVAEKSSEGEVLEEGEAVVALVEEPGDH